MGKAFEKQTETIEYQGEKQIKAIQDNKKQLINDNDYKDKLLLSKEREIFNDIYNKRLDKIEKLNNKIDYNNLKYVVVSSGKKFDFEFLNDIKKGKISLEEAKNKQQNYLNYLNVMRRGNKNANKKKPLQILTFILMQEII